MKRFNVIILLAVLFLMMQSVSAATYKNGTLMPSTLSTQQVNKTNNDIRNDVLNYNSCLSDQLKETTAPENKKTKKQQDKNWDPNPNWWRWENTNQGYTYFY